MQAVVVRHPGGPEVLETVAVLKPTVKTGWTLIQVKGRGINHSEIFTRQGESPSVKFPRILGIEAVGIIADTTDEQRLPVGQTVVTFMGEMGRAYDGGYAEYVLVPNGQIFPVTTRLSWAELAAVPETYYTAYGALLGLRLAAGQQLLIRGGTSGVGVAASKLAHAMANVTVSATTRDVTKTSQLAAVGVDKIIQEEGNQLATAVKFDRILDLIGPATVPDSLQRLNPGGIVSSTGQLGGQWTLPEFEPISEIPNDCYLTSFYSGDVDGQRLQDLLQVITAHEIDVRPVKTYLLSEMQAAHAYLEGQHSFGKVVVLS
ncbi:zinc-binding dehydrogenase [Levilactobacillus fujinensis]|uniref:Zinc-binding dehydrogenase n=1 Tax=Levilactobacillus fujinensis TaxID=2486024 RepID=A0ABW1THS4_9LACO|nr:zinc-binding dehydrogenase [Levilactobacillus fujinensis]